MQNKGLFIIYVTVNILHSTSSGCRNGSHYMQRKLKGEKYDNYSDQLYVRINYGRVNPCCGVTMDVYKSEICKEARRQTGRI